jgi:hypothetical protein
LKAVVKRTAGDDGMVVAKAVGLALRLRPLGTIRASVGQAGARKAGERVVDRMTLQLHLAIVGVDHAIATSNGCAASTVAIEETIVPATLAELVTAFTVLSALIAIVVTDEAFPIGGIATVRSDVLAARSPQALRIALRVSGTVHTRTDGAGVGGRVGFDLGGARACDDSGNYCHHQHAGARTDPGRHQRGDQLDLLRTSTSTPSG